MIYLAKYANRLLCYENRTPKKSFHLQSGVWLWDCFGITHYRVCRIVDDNINTAKLLYGSG
jgi:hypothetical protein